MRPADKDPSEEIKNKLLRNAMEGKWKEVVKIYKQEQAKAEKAKITRSGDTTLHMAISDDQTPTVKKLVAIVDKEALKIKNELGNTPLHVAAYVGNARMCRCIALSHPELIAQRNNDHETPIYLAVVNGRKDAFLCMQRLAMRQRTDKGLELCSNNEGRNILHSAISGEHFELALHIINLYPKLIRHDAQGINPLHLLAMKPSAFQSGTRMGLLQTIVYHCIYIRKFQFYKAEDVAKNYQTFSGLIRSWLCWTDLCREKDSEDPNGHRQPINNDRDLEYSDWELFGDCLSRTFQKVGTILTLGLNHQIGRIIEDKRKHTWTAQIMQKLVEEMYTREFEMGVSSPPAEKKDGDDDGTDIHTVSEKYLHMIDGNGGEDNDEKLSSPTSTKQEVTIMVEKINGKYGIRIRDNDDKKEDKALKQNEKKETPLLIATKHGIIEMVKFILNKFPLAVHNENVDGKNIVLLAVESRQPHVYKYLLRKKMLSQTIFYKTDNDGNSALHLAAKFANRKNWLIPGPALQMQWEVKWYEFVEKSMPPKFFKTHNKEEETPWEIFRENHKDLVNAAKDWLYKTSESCSVVAVLIATVAFTASATVPGGTDKGSPILAKQPAFNVFAIASLVALCFSIASVVMFMTFFTSRHREKDYGTNLPAKLLVELTSLLIAIAAVLVSFCAAHFFVIKDTFKYTAFSLYAATLFPVALYAFWQVPMYYELVKATWRSTPQRVYERD